jgi:hypothetical protein
VCVAQNKLEKPFQLFILLKLFYPNGKAKLELIERYSLLNQLPYKDIRTLNNTVNCLEQIGWLRQNTTTGYYHIVSIHRLRELNKWNSRAAIAVNFNELSSIDAILGSAIYIYLHMAFWRKVNKMKRVRIKGRTYQSHKPSSLSRDQFAPVATTGIKELYGISPKKASYLKHEAAKQRYLIIKKDYDSLPYSYSTIQRMIRTESIDPYVRKINGKYQLQLIDLILPKKELVRLKKIKKG